ncbi:hypothetical protein [Amycolatopsis sp. WGS_07]|uniref:hypothetical protein n=1 Tax=Amycolatopsis sp. WGS_07 TaxID=3076764 RepID=UPI0038730E8B
MTEVERGHNFRPSWLAKSAMTGALVVGLGVGLVGPAMAEQDGAKPDEKGSTAQLADGEGYKLNATGDENGRVEVRSSDEKVRPGQPAWVSARYANRNLFDVIKFHSEGNGIDWKNDLFKLGSSWSGAIQVGGRDCKNLGGSLAARPNYSNGTSGGWMPVDLLNVGEWAINVIPQMLGSDGLITVETKCDFVVPKDASADGLPINYKLDRSNLFGILNKHVETNATLPVAAFRAPNVPTIESPGPNGKIAPGEFIRGRVPDGGYKPKIQVKLGDKTLGPVSVDEDGNWQVAVPADTPAQPYILTARSLGQNGDPDSASTEPRLIEVTGRNDAVDKPVITSPTGDVKAGDELTVTGADGNQVSAVDQNGKVLAGPVTIANGQAKIKLPSDLGGATQIKVVAKPKDGSGEGKASDPKNVVAEKPELFQSDPLTVQPGKDGPVNVSFVPRDGDFSKIAGKTLVLTAPDGVVFTGAASYQTFDDAHNPLKGGGVWLGEDLAKVSNGGKTLTVTLPSADELKNSKMVEFKVTATAKAGEGATPGEKTNGTATVDGYTAPLKVTLAR